MKRAAWDRRVWGVMLKGAIKSDPPMLLGLAWARELMHAPYEGEPTRTLLFMTRKQARAWCDEKNRKWGAEPAGGMSRWRVKPVRVRERVSPC